MLGHNPSSSLRRPHSVGHPWVTKCGNQRSVERRSLSASERGLVFSSDHDQFCTNVHTGAEIDDDFVDLADATRRHPTINCGRQVGAVDAIDGPAEIDRTRAERDCRCSQERRNAKADRTAVHRGPEGLVATLSTEPYRSTEGACVLLAKLSYRLVSAPVLDTPIGGGIVAL
jgi:hypothetical protein